MEQCHRSSSRRNAGTPRPSRRAARSDDLAASGLIRCVWISRGTDDRSLAIISAALERSFRASRAPSASRITRLLSRGKGLENRKQ